jgi:hypothetical protein
MVRSIVILNLVDSACMMIDLEFINSKFNGLSINDPEVSTFLLKHNVRVWYPSSIHTCDIISDRLNVSVDKDSYVERLWWG